MPPISAVLAVVTAILPVAAASTGLPYGIGASGPELQIMTRQLRAVAAAWSSEFSILDMRSGKVYDKLNLGYKGDVQAMELGERYAGGCIGRVILKQKHCPPDREW